jgi:prepilin-type processing-associated H-X9-DG protein
MRSTNTIPKKLRVRWSRNAFTLTELHVLIAAGALVGSVLLASLGDAKDKVQAAACLSNLREIGMAISMYANDYRDSYPPGYIPGRADWQVLLCPYIGKCPKYGSVFTNSQVFICPSVQTPSGKTTRSTYSLHVALAAPNQEFPPPFDGPQHRAKVARSSELVLAADGNLGQTFNVPTSYDALPNFGQAMIACQQPYNPSALDNDSPITASDVGPNYDPGNPGTLGYIRWRHYKNGSANLLFCDGHGESRTASQVKKRNLRYDP